MKTPFERFADKYRVDSNTGCWNWMKGSAAGGYGAFWIDGNSRRAHRVSWILHKGKIPKGKMVLHECDNRKCVNPDHLFLGTHQDNMNDMCNKNRQPKGERNPKAKLSKQDVSKIKNLLNKGKLLQREIAEKFGVTRMTITAINNNKLWSYI